MNRRETLKSISIGSAAIIAGGLTFQSCHDDSYTPSFFSQDEFRFVSDLAEVILPSCAESPGAKEAGVASFLDQFTPACKSDDFCEKLISNIQYLHKVDSNDVLIEELEENNIEAYQELKSLILFAYFSSKEGMTKALQYVAVPGEYIGDISADKHTKAWAI